MTIRDTRLRAAIVREDRLLLVEWDAELRGDPFLYPQLVRTRAAHGLRGTALRPAAG